MLFRSVAARRTVPFTYHIETNEDQHSCADDPAWELEIRVPFIQPLPQPGFLRLTVIKRQNNTVRRGEMLSSFSCLADGQSRMILEEALFPVQAPTPVSVFIRGWSLQLQRCYESIPGFCPYIPGWEGGFPLP